MDILKHDIFRKDTRVRALRRGESLRMFIYASLLLGDVLSIVLGYNWAEHARGEKWVRLGAMRLDWVTVPAYLIFAVHFEAVGRTALMSFLESLKRCMTSLFLATAFTCLVIFLVHAGQQISRLAVVSAFIFATGLIAFNRLIFLKMFIRRDQPLWTRRLVIVDDMPEFSTGASFVIDAAEHNLRPSTTDPSFQSRLGSTLSEYEMVTVACGDRDRLQEWAWHLKAFDIRAEIITDAATQLGAVGLGYHEQWGTMVVGRGTLSVTNRIKKRLFDFVVSLALLAFLAPLMLVTALLIKLDSKGPILFRQPRLGYDNRIFNILKFRSMRAESSDTGGASSTARGDPRITRFGKFIRATSIDELPQLLNVLRGDMSIVGPRPHALESTAEGKLFWEIDPTYWRRHALKPGITGLAQVRGFRGATEELDDLRNRLLSDLEYINHWTLWRDIRILFATLRVIVHDRAF